MPLDTCIANVGEYYSSHYLDSTFARDVKALESRWRDEGSQAVPRRLQALSQRYFRAKTQALDEEDPAWRAKAGEEVAGRRLYENLEVVHQVANVCPILLSTGNPSFDNSSSRLSERAIIGNHIRVRRIGAVWHGESLPSTVDSHRGLLSALSHGCSAGF
jgi:hypothetical protein